MAAKTWTGLGIDTNWNTNGNWLGGAFATSADTVTIQSPYLGNNMTVNVASACTSIDFTNFGSNTLTMTNGLTVGGNVTLISTMTIAGIGGLTISASGTLTSNTKVWGNPLTISNGSTVVVTLADNWTISSLTTYMNTSITSTINGHILTIRGNIDVGASNLLGTTNLVMVGNSSGTSNVFCRSSSYYINNPLEINAPGNAIQIGSSSFQVFNYSGSTNTFKYTTASSITAVGVFYCQNGNLDVSGIPFANMILSGDNFTLLANLNISGNLTATLSTINGAFNIYIGGSLTITQSLTCNNVTFILNGAGTISTTSVNAAYVLICAELIINTISGTITFGTVFNLQGNFTYTFGLVVTTGNTFYVTGIIGRTYTWNTAGIQFNNVTFFSATTIALNSLLTILGTLNIPTTSTFSGSYGFNTKNLNLTINTVTRTLSLSKDAVYNINSGVLTMSGVSTSIRSAITSNDSSIKTTLNLINGATSNINFASATRIDSSGGNPVMSLNTVKNATINWGESNFFAFF